MPSYQYPNLRYYVPHIVFSLNLIVLTDLNQSVVLAMLAVFNLAALYLFISVRIVPVWTELEELDLSSNKKIGDVLQSLLPVLPSSKIKKLHLNNCGLSPQTFQALGRIGLLVRLH